MPKVSVYNIEGKKVSDIDLKEEVFGIEPNEAIIHSVLVDGWLIVKMYIKQKLLTSLKEK